MKRMSMYKKLEHEQEQARRVELPNKSLHCTCRPRSCRAGCADDKQLGLSTIVHDQEAWTRILKGLLQYMSQNGVISLRADVDAHRIGDFTVGRFPTNVKETLTHDPPYEN